MNNLSPVSYHCSLDSDLVSDCTDNGLESNGKLLKSRNN